jgi:hypothetical protein
MELQMRHLRFDNLNLNHLTISSQCSECGREFNGEPVLRELFDDTIMRIKAEYNAHACANADRAAALVA